ncbi:hypothetical protein ACOQFV_13765 [Nocardiopsis changdeensis]|uniref:YtxH domain-containing protein n=1 Tax=Nocardiopsis changdeensis TaxID=2831969 RepID=A0ABX8BGK9_9ACTN|nr:MULTISPECIES: hypothetical protein [Nocardiopsis]QUX21376.1 hypothetical protein KGD84_23575 [Nocardiopsis changdeensis]QYX37307.1 hypothetical protein K1J57_00945 [Nocardiopsis sp. MT53]
MRYRITFVAGLAIGYVLGAKAGRARYEQIVRTARKAADSPVVQEVAGLVGAQVSSAGRTVYDKTVAKMPITSVRDFLARPTEEEIDLIEWETVNGEPPRRNGANGHNGSAEH